MEGEMSETAEALEGGTATILRDTAEELKTLGTVVRNGPSLEDVDQVDVGKTMQKIADIILLESVRVRAMQDAYDRLNETREQIEAVEERVAAIEKTLEMQTWADERDVIGRLLDVEASVPTPPDSETES